jgi:hypothetical protein
MCHERRFLNHIRRSMGIRIPRKVIGGIIRENRARICVSYHPHDYASRAIFGHRGSATLNILPILRFATSNQNFANMRASLGSVGRISGLKNLLQSHPTSEMIRGVPSSCYLTHLVFNDSLLRGYLVLASFSARSGTQLVHFSR